MNRKNTILIAVLINAGLLAVLLITALTTQEEVISPSSFLSESEFQKLEEKPLFGDAVDQALRGQTVAPVEIALPELSKPLEMAAAPQNPSQLIAAAPEPVVHPLPPLAAQPMPSIPAPVVTAPPVPVAAAARIDKALAEVTVKKGDSLEKIAKAHRTTVDEIIKINHLPSSFLKIGQVLKIPAERTLAEKAKPAASERKVESGPEYYTVKVGDNPWTIAMKHHMKVDELLKVNGLNEERARKLKPGDRLRIR